MADETKWVEEDNGTRKEYRWSAYGHGTPGWFPTGRTTGTARQNPAPPVPVEPSPSPGPEVPKVLAETTLYFELGQNDQPPPFPTPSPNPTPEIPEALNVGGPKRTTPPDDFAKALRGEVIDTALPKVANIAPTNVIEALEARNEDEVAKAAAGIILLRALSKLPPIQSVILALTPSSTATQDDIKSFVRRRDQALKIMMRDVPAASPKVP